MSIGGWPGGDGLTNKYAAWIAEDKNSPNGKKLKIDTQSGTFAMGNAYSVKMVEAGSLEGVDGAPTLIGLDGVTLGAEASWMFTGQITGCAIPIYKAKGSTGATLAHIQPKGGGWDKKSAKLASDLKEHGRFKGEDQDKPLTMVFGNGLGYDFPKQTATLLGIRQSVGGWTIWAQIQTTAADASVTVEAKKVI